MRQDVYAIVTETIMKKLEEGVVPWRKPWAANSSIPLRMNNRQPYRGINVWLLGSQGYSSPYWGSFEQISKLGGKVKKGERASMVVFWKQTSRFVNVENEDGDDTLVEKKSAILRYYRVFNRDQCEGLEEVFPEVKKIDFNPITQCEEIIQHMPLRPEIRHGGGRAYYSPDQDYVSLPHPTSFSSLEHYYSVAFHELIHSTGHETRLSRNIRNTYGSSAYSEEELIAEMGASFLCGVAGIENVTIDNSASYIGSWLAALKNDRKMVVFAASRAQKASDFILGKERDGMRC